MIEIVNMLVVRVRLRSGLGFGSGLYVVVLESNRGDIDRGRCATVRKRKAMYGGKPTTSMSTSVYLPHMYDRGHSGHHGV